MIISSNHSMTIFIDHVVNSTIVEQIKLTFNSIDKLNLKLIKTFMYLFQFRFRIFHRNDKFNIISNVLSRFFTKRQNFANATKNNLNFDVNIVDVDENNFQNILIQLSNNFRFKLIIDYKKNFI